MTDSNVEPQAHQQIRLEDVKALMTPEARMEFELSAKHIALQQAESKIVQLQEELVAAHKQIAELEVARPARHRPTARPASGKTKKQ